MALASTGSGEQLSALCFDARPSIVGCILKNPHASLEQARLIAAHHASATGLGMLFMRAEFMRDPEVQRRLWKNPQLNDAQIRQLTATKRLLDVWKLSVGHEVTEKSKHALMRELRTKFSSAPAEERVELIFKTEGRCLMGLSGVPADGRTTALLCARTYSSMLLVQNISHWAAAPPALIAHLLKQPMVMRQSQLMRKLQAHPNAPHRPH